MNNKEYMNLVLQEKYPNDPLVPLDEPFINNAGIIQNLVNCNVGAVAVIHTKAGENRSNHWHRTCWHALYLISGKVKYYERNLDGSNITINEYSAGQMFFTPPNKVHKVEFLEDSIMISLGKDSKDHKSHEKDIVREEF